MCGVARCRPTGEMARGRRLCRLCCLCRPIRCRTSTNKLIKDFFVLGISVVLVLVLIEYVLITDDEGGPVVGNSALKVLMTQKEFNSKLRRSNTTGGMHKGKDVQERWLPQSITTPSPHLHNRLKVVPTLTPRSEGPVHGRKQLSQAKLSNQRATGLSQRHVKNRTRNGAGGAVLRKAPQTLAGKDVQERWLPQSITTPSPHLHNRLKVVPTLTPRSEGPVHGRKQLSQAKLSNQRATGLSQRHVKNRTRNGAGGAVLRKAPQTLAGLKNSQKNRPKGFKQLHVQRSATPTTGEPWPMPQSFRRNITSVYVIDNTKMQYVTKGMTCDIIEKAVKRHRVLLEELHQKALEGERMGGHSMERGWRVLSKIDITVLKKCDQYPSLDSDESYELFIKDNTLYLHASEVWGALHGLQTLSQVISKSKGHLIMWDIHINDYPRFKHRGIMLDTGRHFLSKTLLLQNLDAMAMNKFNVFHWHLVDDQSFPYQSQVFPHLSQKGAYSWRAVYTPEDIRSVVEYARLRGIRVVPEMDTPGHMESWVGLAEILTPCGDPGHYGPIDPTRNVTYEKLTELFREVLDLFPAGTLHLGGDECSYYCWSRYRNITDFMKEHKMKDNFKALFSYYFTRLQTELKRKLKTKLKNSIYWQEVFDEGVQLDSDTIVHVWKEDHKRKLLAVTQAGHRAVLSSCWYLNYIKYGRDWAEYYTCDPQGFSGTLQQKELVIGGEACMWGEYVDDNNLLSNLWPHASAVAERLWSAQTRSTPSIAKGRFEEHRCRMIMRGIPAKAIGGPGPPCTDIGTP